MKIFQIGFNKCGTVSLKKFFASNGVKSVHWLAAGKKNVALLAEDNLKNNKKMFEGIDYTFYSDMEFASNSKMVCLYEKFKLMDEQYEGSKFILNTRDINDWVKSRLNHVGPNKEKLIKVYMNYYKCNEQQIIDLWKEHYHEHIKNVLEYFKDKPKKLLQFRLGESTGSDIATFLPEIEFSHTIFPLTHVTEIK